MRFSDITKNIERLAWIITAILAFIAILVTFNTIRLTIYNWRNEINVMKLVGAGNWYVRGPFLIEGMLYGVSSALISLVVVIPIIYFVSPRLNIFLPGINLWQFLSLNFIKLFLTQFLIGIILGVVSSYFAVKRYLAA